MTKDEFIAILEDGIYKFKINEVSYHATLKTSILPYNDKTNIMIDKNNKSTTEVFFYDLNKNNWKSITTEELNTL